MDYTPARVLSPWDFPGKNIGLGCHFLLQGIFPTRGSNLHLLPWQVDSLPLSHLGSHVPVTLRIKPEVLTLISKVLTYLACGYLSISLHHSFPNSFCYGLVLEHPEAFFCLIAFVVAIPLG